MKQLNKKFKNLENLLKNYKVVRLAYVFGSYAKNDVGKLSDIDIAVLLEQGIKKNRISKLKLKLIHDISIAIKTNKIDLIIMNNAPLSINHEVIKEGRLIVCKDNSEKNNFETYIMSRYLDMKYYIKRHHQIFLRKLGGSVS